MALMHLLNNRPGVRNEPLNYFHIIHALQSRDERMKKVAVKQVLSNNGKVSMKEGGLEIRLENTKHYKSVKEEYERVALLIKEIQIVVIQRKFKTILERNQFLLKQRAANYIKYQWLHTYYKVVGSSKTFL